ncbi:hypothetical protein B5X24_HaOG203382 [Helicoverpa armigera]|uniref:Uncharacterized protein n=1 Tax=Helicoverpa armigera TaxID=29058 RepID=A0A2W1BQP9_HELAM|nr:hypothetical protein B5X24_HaOG203382 [Helicoverpa armigera]
MTIVQIGRCSILSTGSQLHPVRLEADPNIFEKRATARLNQRIAEEAQLLAEEKWIIEALRKVKQQRNGLQIERLHLENLKATINREELRSIISSDVAVNKDSETAQSQSAEADTPTAPDYPLTEIIPVTNLALLDGPVAGIDDEMCNTEKLNLSVTNSVFTNQHMASLDIEEDDDDLDNALEDDEDMENCLIEMNMLMQSK